MKRTFYFSHDGKVYRASAEDYKRLAGKAQFYTGLLKKGGHR